MEEFNPFSPIQVYRRRKAFHPSKENRELTKLSLKALSGCLSAAPTRNGISDSSVVKEPIEKTKLEYLTGNSERSLDKNSNVNLKSTKAANNDDANKLKNNLTGKENVLSSNYLFDKESAPLTSLENLPRTDIAEKVATRRISFNGATSTKFPTCNDTEDCSHTLESTSGNTNVFSCADLKVKLEACVSESASFKKIILKRLGDSKESSLKEIPFKTKHCKQNSMNLENNKSAQGPLSHNIDETITFCSKGLLNISKKGQPNAHTKAKNFHPSLTHSTDESFGTVIIDIPKKRLDFSRSSQEDHKTSSSSQCSKFKNNSERLKMPQHLASQKSSTKAVLDLDSSDDDLTLPPLSQRLQLTPKILQKYNPAGLSLKHESPSCSSTSGSEEFETFLQNSMKKSCARNQNQIHTKSSSIKQDEVDYKKKSSNNKSNVLPAKLSSSRNYQTPPSFNTVKAYISPKSNARVSLYATVPRFRRLKKARHQLDSSDDSEIVDEVFSSPSPNGNDDSSSRSHEKIHPSSLPRISTLSTSDNQNRSQCKSSLSFLATLSSSSSTCNQSADVEALSFKNNFSKKKTELLKKLYSMFNENVFSSKLPQTMSITWNPRMRRTAGFCYYKLNPTVPPERFARIELASKVIDSAERLRDTLIHEMCHAASWIIHGYRDGHGPLWKFWAQRANKIFPSLPAIVRCHSYEINTKYVYKCSKCSGCIGRHSKSLDVNKKVCGRCGGRFELLVNGKSSTRSSTTKTPTGFALFVKENYKDVKSANKNLKHSDIMKILSTDFNLKKTNSGCILKT